MKRNNQLICVCVFVCFGLSACLASGADAYPLPAIIQKGFSLFSSGGTAPAVEAWRKGGASNLEQHLSFQTQNLRQMAMPMGNYKSFEVVETKAIGARSRIYYIAIQFERGAVFSSFLVFNTTGNEWAIQRVLFSASPESIMPWLATNQAE